jgi:hypothetical protein
MGFEPIGLLRRISRRSTSTFYPNAPDFAWRDSHLPLALHNNIIIALSRPDLLGGHSPDKQLDPVKSQFQQGRIITADFLYESGLEFVTI